MEFGKDDIELILDELEVEKQNLERLIKEAVVEKDFLTAHFLQEGLVRITSQISQLRNLEDGSHRAKRVLQSQLDSMQSRLDNLSDQEREVVQGEIDKRLDDLYKLITTPKEKKSNSTVLSYVKLTVSGRIRGFIKHDWRS